MFVDAVSTGQIALSVTTPDPRQFLNEIENNIENRKKSSSAK